MQHCANNDHERYRQELAFEFTMTVLRSPNVDEDISVYDLVTHGFAYADAFLAQSKGSQHFSGGTDNAI